MTDEENNPPGVALLRWFEGLPQQAAALEARRREAERARAAELERRDLEHAALVEAIRRQTSRLEAFADGAGLRRYALHGARYGDHMTLRAFPCEGEPTATLVLGWAWGRREGARDRFRAAPRPRPAGGDPGVLRGRRAVAGRAVVHLRAARAGDARGSGPVRFQPHDGTTDQALGRAANRRGAVI